MAEHKDKSFNQIITIDNDDYDISVVYDGLTTDENDQYIISAKSKK